MFIKKEKKEKDVSRKGAKMIKLATDVHRLTQTFLLRTSQEKKSNRFAKITQCSFVCVYLRVSAANYYYV